LLRGLHEEVAQSESPSRQLYSSMSDVAGWLVHTSSLAGTGWGRLSELLSTMVTALATVLLPLTAETVPFALSALSKHVVGENIRGREHPAPEARRQARRPNLPDDVRQRVQPIIATRRYRRRETVPKTPQVPPRCRPYPTRARLVRMYHHGLDSLLTRPSPGRE
jgi:hypothetical protein